MNIRIAIVDDEPAQVAFMADLCRQWAKNAGQVAELEDFESAEQFLFHHEADSSIDILLLDIQMKQMDGLSLARKIRQLNETIQLIFITGYPDFIAEGYDVAALNYLMKPVKPDRFFEVMDRALKRLSRQEKTLTVSVGGELLKIALCDIVSLESFGHITRISTRKGCFELKMPLTELESQLGDGFVRCHRSYLVGLAHISRITRTDVILDGGQAIPLSRRLNHQVNQAFIHHYKEVR